METHLPETPCDGKDRPETGVIWDPGFSDHLKGMFHLESAKRMNAIQAVLDHEDLAGNFQKIDFEPASIQQIAWIHSRDYIRTVAQTANKPATSLDLDTCATEKSFDVARMAVGGVFALVDAVCAGRIKRGFAFVRPPGHHALAEKAMGFCIFNNIALAAAYLNHAHGFRRILIVDLDAHHGNGIQNAFYSSRDVLYFSFHLFPGFPGTGNFNETGSGPGDGFTINVPLPKGCDDRYFIHILSKLLCPVAVQYQPEFILVACGFDLHRLDKLGQMRATAHGYARMTALLMDLANQLCDGRLAFVLEGGYNLQAVRQCALAVMTRLCSGRGVPASLLNANKFKCPPCEKAIHFQRPFWKSL